ncbi:Ku protein [Compostibacter hankyongensis]|uniref:Non-homologous end joining protein Ku n=1 Tax=Compostibacter hankyongensis TaxID=1007089 RepID=A0ABP8FYS8_9BACT
MKSIWTGDIGFGLVSIPVKLYSATQGSELDFDLLDKSDHARIRYMRVNEDTGKEVEWEDIVRAYDLNGKYIVLTPKDFENASPEKTKRIEIMEFVDESEIDSIYYETPYYVEPEKKGQKPYLLLREALRKTKKAGLGTYVLRNREHLCVIKVVNDLIVLNRIRFEEEIRNPEEVNAPVAKKINPGELKMAVTLIEQMTGDFKIGNYKDTYSAELLKVIKAKARGKKTTAPKLKVVHKRTDNLMEQLKASLGKKRRKTS